MSDLEWLGEAAMLPKKAGRLFCLGGNYTEHQKEMGQLLAEPSVFVKVEGSLVPGEEPVLYPPDTESLHYEGEFVLVMGEVDPNITPDWRDVAGLAAGLDLTRRDLQHVAKKDGSPWERAKSWPGSARLSPIVPTATLNDPQTLRLVTRVNGELRQSAAFSDMIQGPDAILAYLHHWFPLRAGDLIFTGTPKGVGPLLPGDRVEVAIENVTGRSWTVVDGY